MAETAYLTVFAKEPPPVGWKHALRICPDTEEHVLGETSG